VGKAKKGGTHAEKWFAVDGWQFAMASCEGKLAPVLHGRQ
jgi:hypothetical protein